MSTALVLTSKELREIIRGIEPDLTRLAAKYDEEKYPPRQLKFLRPACLHESLRACAGSR